MKRLVGLNFILFVFLQIVSLNPIFSQSLEDSLLVYYSFDGDSLDMSGNNYNPVLFRASFVEDRNGFAENAVYFNGVSDLIILPDTTTLKPPFPMTIAFWVKMDDLNPEHGVFFTNDFYRFAHSGAWLNLSSTQRLSISYGDGNGFSPGNRRSKSSNMLLETDHWYYITGVFVNEDNLQIFINGMQDEGFVEGGAYTMDYRGTGGNIGRKDANYQLVPFFFKGFLDEFKYWNRQLSDAEVWELFQEETVAVAENLVTENFSIYPNPATNQIFFNYPLGSLPANMEVQIIDVTGKILIQSTTIENIELASLREGLYFVQLINRQTGKVIGIKKFIKQ